MEIRDQHYTVPVSGPPGFLKIILDYYGFMGFCQVLGFWLCTSLIPFRLALCNADHIQYVHVVLFG